VIFSGKAPKLTPEEDIIKSSKPLPGKKPWDRLWRQPSRLRRRHARHYTSV